MNELILFNRLSFAVKIMFSAVMAIPCAAIILLVGALTLPLGALRLIGLKRQPVATCYALYGQLIAPIVLFLYAMIYSLFPNDLLVNPRECGESLALFFWIPKHKQADFVENFEACAEIGQMTFAFFLALPAIALLCLGGILFAPARLLIEIRNRTKIKPVRAAFAPLIHLIAIISAVPFVFIYGFMPNTFLPEITTKTLNKIKDITE